MPTYAYACCEQTVTVSRSIHDPEVAPVCGKCNQEMKRIYDTPPIKFKGKGWGHQR